MAQAIRQPRLAKNKVLPEAFSVQNFSSSKRHEAKTVPIQIQVQGAYFLSNFGLGASNPATTLQDRYHHPHFIDEEM